MIAPLRDIFGYRNNPTTFKSEGTARGTHHLWSIQDVSQWRQGVFTGKKDHEKTLYLKKEKFTQAKQNFEIVVDQLPTRAGIDPINKLIDRIPDDNTMDITKP